MPSRSRSGAYPSWVRFHSSSPVSSEVYGILGWPERRVVGAGADHEHLADAGSEGDDPGDDVHDRVAPALRGLGLEPLEGEVAGVVVHIGEFLDLASPREHLEPARDPPPDPQRIGDVADHEMPGLVARVDLAEQVLSGAGRREERAGSPALFTDDPIARNSIRLLSFRSSETTPVSPRSPSSLASFSSRLIAAWRPSTMSSVMLPNLAARERLEPAGEPADQAERVDAVAHHDIARVVPLLRQTVDLVARQPRHQHRDRLPKSAARQHHAAAARPGRRPQRRPPSRGGRAPIIAGRIPLGK